MLQLLTTTGCRNEAFQLCQRWMKNQTYTGEVKWIIVDDGETPQDMNFERPNWDLIVARPEPFWKEGNNTQKRNLQVGLEFVEDEHPLVIIEDDDYYHPQWLSTVERNLRKYDLVGEKNADYYNIQKGVHRKLPNSRHASLCSTAVKGEGLTALRHRVATDEKFIDINLWKTFRGLKRLIDSNYVIGMKGLPGRSNIGIGKDMKGNPDPDMKILKTLIGEDARHYENF